MGLETATYPNNLNANWPLGTDPKAQGDDHLRLLKKVLKDVFPAGWDDAPINSLIARFHATVSAGHATGAGTITDVPTVLTKLGQSSEFTATSEVVFLNGWMTVNKTANANMITVDVRIWNVTTSALVSTDNIADHGLPASTLAATSTYVPQYSGMISDLVVGSKYRAELWAKKSIGEGPLAGRWRTTVFNL